MSPDLNSDLSVRARLRQATQLLHRGLERHIALDGEVWTETTYCALLSKLLGIYDPLEQRLDRINWKDSGIAIAHRRKTRWLESDLLHFGMSAISIDAVARCRDIPELETLEDGFGALYVLEGATLGGQIIIRTLGSQLGISAGSGGRFFASYGRSIGLRWREYLTALERLGTCSRAADAVEASAIRTFLTFDRWFAETPKPESNALGCRYV